MAAELRPYDPTWRDRIAAVLMGTDYSAPTPERRNLVQGLLGSSGIGNSGMSVSDLTPVGAVLGLQESAQHGDKLGMAMNGAGLLAMAAPLAKASAVSKSLLSPAVEDALASRTASLYNPTVKPPRPFEADYPVAKYPGNGAPTDGYGRLAETIDGSPITARYVAGRIADGGGDMALPREALDEIAKAGTGRGISEVPASAIGRDMGRVSVNKYTRAPTGVAIREGLPEPSRQRVAAHEIGHVIDQIAGELPTTGVMNELKGVYNTLNTGRERGSNLMGPQHVGYMGHDVPRELWAELIRAYMADPNYAKTVAPKSAEVLRKAVNPNPRLNKTIQFNSLGAALAGGALSQPPNDDW